MASGGIWCPSGSWARGTLCHISKTLESTLHATKRNVDTNPATKYFDLSSLLPSRYARAMVGTDIVGIGQPTKFLT